MPSDDDDDDRPRRARRRRDEDEDDDGERPRRKRRRREDDDDSDATGGVIPYKNGQALAAYYCGVFSFIPLFGFLIAVPSIVLGVLGILYVNKHPNARGTGHAVFGIAGGLVGPFVGLGILYGVLALAKK